MQRKHDAAEAGAQDLRVRVPSRSSVSATKLNGQASRIAIDTPAHCPRGSCWSVLSPGLLHCHEGGGLPCGSGCPRSLSSRSRDLCPESERAPQLGRRPPKASLDVVVSASRAAVAASAMAVRASPLALMRPRHRRNSSGEKLQWRRRRRQLPRKSTSPPSPPLARRLAPAAAPAALSRSALRLKPEQLHGHGRLSESL